MQIRFYQAPVRLPAVAASLSKALQLFAILCLAPLLVALLAGNYQQLIVFAGLALASWLVGWCGDFLLAGAASELNQAEALVVTALAYLLFSLCGAVAFWGCAPWLDAFFEAMSGITTTGLSVLPVEQLSPSLLFFRSYLQWLGGIGIIVLSVIVLFGPGQTAHLLYASEFGPENLRGNVVATARLVTQIYSFFTALGFLAFWLGGLSAFDALLYVMATISTGGFAPHPQGLALAMEQGHLVLPWLVSLFMLCGSISLPLYYVFVKKGWRPFVQDRQFCGLLLLALAAMISLAVWGQASFLEAVFNGISAVSTTGFNLGEPAGWPQDNKLLTSLFMMVGGSAYSTAGGIKILRLLLLLKLIVWLLRRLHLPAEAKIAIKLGGRAIDPGEYLFLLGFLASYAIILALSTLVLSGQAYPVLDAFFESVSALGTVGLSVGISHSGLEPLAKIMLIFDMWAGRLEIISVLLALYPGTWVQMRWKT